MRIYFQLIRKMMGIVWVIFVLCLLALRAVYQSRQHRIERRMLRRYLARRA